jgi:hypothetical protein
LIKSRWLRWAGNEARTGESRGMYRVLVVKSKGRTSFEDRGIDERIILKWILEKLDVGAWMGSILLRIRTSGGLLWTRWWTFVLHKLRGKLVDWWGSVSFSGWTLLHGVLVSEGFVA